MAVNSGIDRSAVFVTNLVREYAGDPPPPPSPEELNRDFPELLQEIKRVQPEYIGLVGAHAARQFCVSDEFSMDTFHGLAFPPSALSPYWTMPLFHPASALHMPSIAAKIQWDFTQFGKLVRGETLPTGHLADAYPDCIYTNTDTYVDTGIDTGLVTAIDTEGSVQKPWGWSACCLPGNATVAHGPARICGLAVMHAAMHDLPVLEAMGVQIGRFTDTMLMAALLGTEPLGLKSLARRHCGMVCRDYSDVVQEARREKALEYLSQAVDYAATNTDKTA